ncbi:hypothetical protein MMC30_002206 [Trapelia coarctata]|nr:hypothetical protein [Trapelia coarctata]
MEGILSLPNELLIYILSPFSTKLLLPLAIVSRRFHDVVLRILHHRLLLAASLRDRKLILECYHPSSKNTEPYLFCDYLGTPGLSSEIEGEGDAYDETNGMGRLGRLGGLYSRFRPIRPEMEQRVFRSHPAGDVPGHPGSSTIFPSGPSPTEQEPEGLVSHSVHLDSHELFSQLCVVTNLVQLGPRRGVFYSFVNVADGVVRIFRNWLTSRAGETPGKASLASSENFEENGGKGFSEPESDIHDTHTEARMLWVDSRQNVGIRVRIKEMKWARDMPILLHQNEDPAVTYSMEYEELLIRTNHLLLAVERTIAEQSNVSGKAMIFGSFVRTAA